MDFAALSRPVHASARAIKAPPRSAAQVISLFRGLRHPVVLAGSWAAGNIVVAADPISVQTLLSDPFEVFDWQPKVTGAVPQGAVGGGWFGWVGFAEPGQSPPHALGFYPNVLRLRDGQWWDEALVGIIDDGVLQTRRQQMQDRLSGVAVQESYALGPVTASRNLQAHCVAVERCIQRIRDGDIYQANICLTLLADFEGSSAALAADLIDALQPPYGAFLGLGDVTVASASPELFLRRDGRQVRSRPIKGTRPRSGAGESEKSRLAGSPKDRAENVMIVDLVRNDLSRVAETGSVRVPELLDVVAHPGVWHLVSTVEARLAAGVTDGDLLRAAFPPGSVSGTPKHRAIEVIAELEDRPRGVYTGAIGYASPIAGAEFSVAIRTVEIRASRLSLGVGGGITVDSTPAEEWFECFDKAWPLLAAVGGDLAEPAVAVRPETDPRVGGGICDTSLLHFGQPLERAEHVARLERSGYELYQQTLPVEAFVALVQTPHDPVPWQRQRVDVMPDGTVRIERSAVAAPASLDAKPGERAVVLAGDGFGGHKWSDRHRHAELEAAFPGHIVILRDASGLLESTRANVVGIEDGKLITPPLDGRILPGVTRTVLLELARDCGIEIQLRSPDPQRLQALATVSSIAGLRWIRSCESPHGVVGYDGPGEVLTELSKRLVARWTDGARVRG